MSKQARKRGYCVADRSSNGCGTSNWRGAGSSSVYSRLSIPLLLPYMDAMDALTLDSTPRFTRGSPSPCYYHIWTHITLSIITIYGQALQAGSPHRQALSSPHVGHGQLRYSIAMLGVEVCWSFYLQVPSGYGLIIAHKSIYGNNH